MHVAVIGAGALGAVYGVRLALHADVTVTFVVRPKRAGDASPIVIERVKGDVRDVLEAPSRATRVPGDADVVLVCVGTEDLEGLALGESDAPIVVLTPMMPRDWQKARAAFGPRILAAMPSVVAYARKDDGVVRHWLPPARTRIDEPRAGDVVDTVNALVDALDRAGLGAHVEMAVHETNPATTVCAIPLAMALCVAGSLEALANDDDLATLAVRACSEGVAIGRRIGRPEIGAQLAPFVASPLALRAMLAGLRRFSPEGLFYLEAEGSPRFLAAFS